MIGTDRSFQAGFVLALFFWLLAAEVFCRYAAESGFWYARLDFSGRLVSLAELRDRIAFHTREPGTVCLLGDSVVGSSALVENRIDNADEYSLTRRLRTRLGDRGRRVFSLSADGLLVPDVEAVLSEFSRSRPGLVLILLNYRMFAPEFDKESAAASRSFLVAGRDGSGEPPSLSLQVETFAQEHWGLFRSTQLLKSIWYFPTQKAFFQKQLERVVPRPEEDDLAGAALKFKVAPYYRGVIWHLDTPAFRSLGRLLAGVQAARIPSLLVLTPQNTAYLEGVLDPSLFAANRALLADVMRRHAGPGVRYFDWADRYPATSFLDHTHLTRDGNDRYAADLTALVLEGP